MTSKEEASLRVLLVEDSPSDALLVQRYLLEQHHKFEITSVETIRCAKKVLADAATDVIVLDMSLPDGEGVSLIDQLQTTYRDVPIVVLTGNDDDELAIDSLRRGAQDYLVKGNNSPDTLGRVLRYAVERHAMSRQLEAANSELNELSQRAESANRQKSLFLANMSHEIRTPLTAILGFAEMIERDRRQLCERDVDQALATIRRNGDHLLTLINDILDLSKIEADELKLESLPTSPAELIGEVHSLMESCGVAKGLRMLTDIDENVPAAVLTDAVRRQLVLRFSDN